MKKRTAKQKAATRKLVAMNKRKTKRKSNTSQGIKKRKTPTKQRKTATIKRSTSNTKSMKRTKRYSRSLRSGGLKIGTSLKTGIIGEVVKGIGAGSLVGMVMGRVMPDSPLTPIVSTGAAFLAGGVTGGIAQVVLSGGLSSFGGIFGGVSQQPNEVGV